LVEQVAKDVGTRPPARIFLTVEVNAYASFHRGLPGMLAGDSKLTVGVPLLAGLQAEELRAIVAHELAHFQDVGAMRICAIAFEIEGGLTRMISYGSRRIRTWHKEKQQITVFSVVGLAFTTLSEEVANALVAPLRGPCRRLRERLLTAMEFRSDAIAAQVVSAEAVVGALENVGQLAAEMATNGGDKSCERPSRVAAEKVAQNGARRFRERKRLETQRGRPSPLPGGATGFTLERIKRLRCTI
jgi:Zn-dependent protease with chaperone function